MYIGLGGSFQCNVLGDQIEDAIRDELSSGDVAILIGGGFALSDVECGKLYEDFEALLLAEGVDIGEGDNLIPAGRLGVGFGWCLTKRLVLNTEAGIVATTLKQPDIDDIEDLNYLSFQAGLQYRF